MRVKTQIGIGIKIRKRKVKNKSSKNTPNIEGYFMNNFRMNNLASVDSILNDNKVDNKRIKLPKLLVLVSKYPIYEDMEEFLKRIKVWLTEYTSVPLESMILNLVYEFPHPGEKSLIQTSFWKSKKKAVYEYETLMSLPFWDSKYFWEIFEYQEKMHIIWSIVEKILFGKSIVIVSK